MLRTETPAETQSAIACILRRQLQLPIFQTMEPEAKRSHLESAHLFLFNADALRTDKLAILASLEVLATYADEGVKTIAQATLDHWHNPL
ncbi:MAG: hypothetical protein H7Z11_20310 [Verrucomicrobia bacterium]|nr:hypothetical protein [Leptolyngbya sp. ES-bin-22]